MSKMQKPKTSRKAPAKKEPVKKVEDPDVQKSEAKRAEDDPMFGIREQLPRSNLKGFVLWDPTAKELVGEACEFRNGDVSAKLFWCDGFFNFKSKKEAELYLGKLGCWMVALNG